MQRKNRVRKLDMKQRDAIRLLYESGSWTMTKLAEQFDVSVPRISQIVNNYYDEMVNDEE